MRSPVDDALADLARALDRLGVTWFLFGAQAAIIYGSTRVTEDIDVTVDLHGHTARELVSVLTSSGFALRVGDSAAFVEQTRVLPVVHVETAIPVDFVFAGPGLEELFFARARRHQREGTSIPVASPEDLLVMKILAGRPRDIEDVRAVLRAIGPKLEMNVITETLTLLEQALAQSDLLPMLARLRDEARAPRASLSRRTPARPTKKRTPQKRTPPKRPAKKR